MDQAEKDLLLEEARGHIDATREKIGRRLDQLEEELERESEAYYAIDSRQVETAFEDRLLAFAIGANTTQIRDQIEQLKDSPYFARCDLEFGDEPMRPYYFAKASASELGIYSWTSPVAALRFENPGNVSYMTPKGEERKGKLARKDQYMIARGHLNFMTTEAAGMERQLVYQEHFSTRKTGFMLPDVVAQMEKAQDQVIRADHRGPFVISGPAGSGKTTLALHRVAYLRQAPETAEMYPAETILVLVQDNGTEDYFSHLLPELGIHDVQITTFAAWALERLELRQYFYRVRPGRDEAERDRYEYAKLQALRGGLPEAGKTELRRPERMLLTHYERFLDDGQMGLLRQELADGALDRFDLTLLLLLRERLQGRLTRIVEDTQFLRGGKTRTKRTEVPLEYSLILADEFQNYLPEQLQVLRRVAHPKHQSMLYVGDLAQQTQFGTLREWAQIDEAISPERAIRLEKVYRNTRQILEYIQRRGYEVAVPRGVSEGPEVVERVAGDVVEAIEYIVGLTRTPGMSLGIIAKNPETVETYREYFKEDASVHCLTMREAQGVEFDVVVLIEAAAMDEASEGEAEFLVERERINRDQLYVALTRAMRELHIIKC